MRPPYFCLIIVKTLHEKDSFVNSGIVGKIVFDGETPLVLN